MPVAESGHYSHCLLTLAHPGLGAHGVRGLNAEETLDACDRRAPAQSCYAELGQVAG